MSCWWSSFSQPYRRSMASISSRAPLSLTCRDWSTSRTNGPGNCLNPPHKSCKTITQRYWAACTSSTPTSSSGQLGPSAKASYTKKLDGKSTFSAMIFHLPYSRSSTQKTYLASTEAPAPAQIAREIVWRVMWVRGMTLKWSSQKGSGGSRLMKLKLKSNNQLKPFW